ncbi:MFS transporter [Paraburkholderia caledonica]|jgi:metabolite-proton symporter|uniref:MFS transporter n=1 Tax=Paraburkholderia caledonica TaxID=134536 RepID=UPI0005A96BC2|nr:MFS transporter [Paraburkholderia caledonica]
MDINKDYQDTKSKSRILLASWIGSVIEWYDYSLYGTAAALVFAHLFFPNVSGVVGTVATFGTFAVGFVARPLGGIVAGHFGDKIGRKATLVLTLMTMGIATALIGCLPTYAQAGIWAPVLLVLLRLVQGFAVGGEWGGAALMAVESAPSGKAGFFGAFPQTGVSAGMVLGTGAFALISSVMSNETFLSVGWRIPFLISIVLAALGLYVRFKIGESPVFEEIRRTKKQLRNPLGEALRCHWKEVLLAIGSRCAEAGNYYIYTVFVLSYVAQHTSITRSAALLCVMLAGVVNVLLIPLSGAVSDRIGRRPVIITGALFLTMMAYPFFLMAGSGSVMYLGLGLVLTLGLGHAIVYGPIAAYYCELFPATMRYSGMSIAYQVVSIVLGGFTPLFASMLLVWSNGAILSVVALVAITSFIAALTMMFSRETAPHLDSRAERETVRRI